MTAAGTPASSESATISPPKPTWKSIVSAILYSSKRVEHDVQVLLLISAADPEWGFEKKLDKKKNGKTKRKLKLKCKTDNPNAKVKWFKDGKEIKPSDTNFLITSNEGVQELEIKCAEKEDSGKYTCKVVEFGKEGEDETTCDVNIGGKNTDALEST